MVGQIKPSLSFHGEAEHGRHILVFVREMKFAICFVIFQIVGTQKGDLVPICQKSRFSRTLAALPVRSRK